MTTVSHGKPYAGNPHVRFEEGASESAKPSRKALLHTQWQGNYGAPSKLGRTCKLKGVYSDKKSTIR